MTLVELARLRQGCYRLCGALWLYPDAERLAHLVAAARAWQGENAFLAAFAFFGPWQRLLTALHGLTEAEAAALAATYVRLFLVNPDGGLCQAHESFYLGARGSAAGWSAAQLEREYAAAGLQLAPALQELPDHAAVELEFMAFLCQQEARAWEEKAVTVGLQTLERQGAFLRQHLGRWFPAFARQVAAADAADLYAITANAVTAFLPHDQELVALLLEKVQAGADVLGGSTRSLETGGRT